MLALCQGPNRFKMFTDNIAQHRLYSSPHSCRLSHRGKNFDSVEMQLLIKGMGSWLKEEVSVKCVVCVHI